MYPFQKKGNEKSPLSLKELEHNEKRSYRSFEGSTHIVACLQVAGLFYTVKMLKFDNGLNADERSYTIESLTGMMCSTLR